MEPGATVTTEHNEITVKAVAVTVEGEGEAPASLTVEACETLNVKDINAK